MLESRSYHVFTVHSAHKSSVRLACIHKPSNTECIIIMALYLIECMKMNQADIHGSKTIYLKGKPIACQRFSN